MQPAGFLLSLGILLKWSEKPISILSTSATIPVRWLSWNPFESQQDKKQWHKCHFTGLPKLQVTTDTEITPCKSSDNGITTQFSWYQLHLKALEEENKFIYIGPSYAKKPLTLLSKKKKKNKFKLCGLVPLPSTNWRNQFITRLIALCYSYSSEELLLSKFNHLLHTHI